MLLVITIILFANMHVPSYFVVLFCMSLYITSFLWYYTEIKKYRTGAKEVNSVKVGCNLGSAS